MDFETQFICAQTGKREYSETAAKRAIKYASGSGKSYVPVRFYECGYCRSYHLSSMSEYHGSVKTCARCGGKFKHEDDKAIYCSKACKRAAANRRRKDRDNAPPTC